MASAEDISIQLKWYHKFQFAGYYAAIEQGYFEQEGLNVTLIEGGPTVNHQHQLINGSSQYATLGSEAIESLALGAPILFVAAIFQHAPEVLISLKDSQIKTVEQMKGKSLMLADPKIAGQINAMLKRNNLSIEDYQQVPYDGDVSRLASKEIDVIYGYLSNEPYQLIQQGLEVDIFSPRDYGIDFYGDGLATLQSELEDHSDRVAAVRKAVIRGWSYALSHQEEIISVILDLPTNNPIPFDREHQRYEAQKTSELVDSSLIPIGHISPDRWAAMFDTFNESTGGQAVFNDNAVYDEFYNNRDWLTQLAWLAVAAALIILALYLWNRTLQSRLNEAIIDLEAVAFKDALTDLKNRSAMILYFERCRVKKRRNLYLALIDMTDLKNLNRAQGFQKADVLIQKVAEVIASQPVSRNHFYSLYGGKFAILAPASSQKDFEQKVNNINAEINQISELVQIRSGGIRLDFQLDNSTLTTRAELALQHAKAMKETNLVYFNSAIVDSIERRELLLSQVALGITNKEFIAHYQPKVNHRDNSIGGFEALIRWDHPTDGLRYPGYFLPTVESSPELMIELENYILEKILSEVSLLVDAFGSNPKFRVSINLSSKQFNRENLVPYLLSACKRYQVEPERIEFELTESSMLENLDMAIKLCNELKASGFEVALDDFGTGYSSLSYIQNLPISVVKLDYTFVRNIPADIRSGYVVEHIISLSHKLGLKIVAEGVERIDQLDYLSALNVDLIQGFYFFKPMSIEKACALKLKTEKITRIR